MYFDCRYQLLSILNLKGATVKFPTKIGNRNPNKRHLKYTII